MKVILCLTHSWGVEQLCLQQLKNNRRFIGCEINEDYVKSYEDNYKQYLKRWQNDINRKNKEAVSEKEENN